jgi:hypothetical protein
MPLQWRKVAACMGNDLEMNKKHPYIFRGFFIKTYQTGLTCTVVLPLRTKGIQFTPKKKLQ